MVCCNYLYPCRAVNFYCQARHCLTKFQIGSVGSIPTQSIISHQRRLTLTIFCFQLEMSSYFRIKSTNIMINLLPYGTYFNSQQEGGIELDIAMAMAMDRVIVVYENLILQIRRMTYSNAMQSWSFKGGDFLILKKQQTIKAFSIEH